MTSLENAFWFWLLSALMAALFAVLAMAMFPALLFMRFIDQD